MLRTAAALILVASLALAACSSNDADTTPTTAKTVDTAKPGEPAFRDTFTVDKSRLTATGKGRYVDLTPGRMLNYTSDDGGTLTVTCLPDTRVIDGVTTRVVEEREMKKGQLTEISRNFMALDPATGDVYYFGEETDTYKNGKIASHEGSWTSGQNNARFGMLVCGTAKVGDRFQQEVAPGVAMDRVEVVSVDEKITVPAGTFTRCIHLVETTPLESGKAHKWFAPGIGLIKDDEFELATVPTH